MTKVFFLLCLLFSTQAPCAAPEVKKSEEEARLEARALMDGVYESFLKVIPYVYSDEKGGELLVKNTPQKNDLLKNLSDISEFFKGAKHVEYFQRPGFRPSLETINYHLDDTIHAVKNDNFIFAQKRMRSLTALCISCHTQLSEKSSQNAFGSLINKAKQENFESDFAYANYLFLVRRFAESEKYFDLAIEKALKESRDHELYASLRKQISIYTKISFEPKKASAFVAKYENDTRFPPLAKNMLSTWSVSLKKWNNFQPKKIKSIRKFINTYLAPLEQSKGMTAGGESDVTLLIASGVLSKYFTEHPKTVLAPEILYWLSIAERRLSHTYFFSLSDLYLKDCIKLYPKSRLAKKCYAEYAENIEFGFSGSGGTDIPVEEKQELERLKGLLK